jgi:hypothetical protein
LLKEANGIKELAMHLVDLIGHWSSLQLFHFAQKSDHSGMFPEKVHNEAIDTGRGRRQSGDWQGIGRTDPFAQMMTCQLGFGLLAFLLQLFVLFRAFLQPMVQFQGSRTPTKQQWRWMNQ